MATKPTIYKLRIGLSDLERNYYDTLRLTVALHPSETPERMMARVMAYCINAQESLVFTKGLSDVEQPDIWARTMDDKITLWIDVGEPAPERVKKSSHKADQVRVYSFNSKSDVWWQQGCNKFALYDVSMYRLAHDKISELATMLERTMDMSVTITGESAYVTTGLGELEVTWETLQ
ncbi:MAG: hypothetical protein ACI9LU_002195 [Polaribacter sp.]